MLFRTCRKLEKQFLDWQREIERKYNYYPVISIFNVISYLESVGLLDKRIKIPEKNTRSGFGNIYTGKKRKTIEYKEE